MHGCPSAISRNLGRCLTVPGFHCHSWLPGHAAPLPCFGTRQRYNARWFNRCDDHSLDWSYLFQRCLEDNPEAKREPRRGVNRQQVPIYAKRHKWLYSTDGKSGGESRNDQSDSKTSGHSIGPSIHQAPVSKVERGFSPASISPSRSDIPCCRRPAVPCAKRMAARLPPHIRLKKAQSPVKPCPYPKLTQAAQNKSHPSSRKVAD